MMKRGGLFSRLLFLVFQRSSKKTNVDECYYQLQPFPLLSKLESEASSSRSEQIVAVDFLALLSGGGGCDCFFPYFMLVAFEAGSAARAIALLLVYPIVCLLSATAALKLVTFVALAGLPVRHVALVSQGVLVKFFGDAVRRRSFEAMERFGGRRISVTELPTIMVQAFARQHLGVDTVIGTGLATRGHRLTGFADERGFLVGGAKAEALRAAGVSPNVGLGGRESDYAFMSFCEEGFLIPSNGAHGDELLPRDKLPLPIIFYDGRLAVLPTPAMAALLFLWMPIGFPLALIRIAAGSLLPMRFVLQAFRILGVRIAVSNDAPTQSGGDGCGGVLFVCNHRTLLDPVFLSAALRRPVTAVTYSISRLSELLSPLPTVRLRRNRAADAASIAALLRQGDLAVCPEGTTLRTPYLLRFSSLFAELTDRIAPVAVNVRSDGVFFHGTSARGAKAADPFFFFMNPSPCYEITFLPQLPEERTCGGGTAPHDVANHVQRLLAQALGFRCTGLTRKDKYGALAGNDGNVTLNPKF